MKKSILIIANDHDNVVVKRLKSIYIDLDIDVSIVTKYDSAKDIICNNNYKVIILFEGNGDTPLHDIIFQLNLNKIDISTIILTPDFTIDKLVICNELGIYDILDIKTDIKNILLTIDKALNT